MTLNSSSQVTSTIECHSCNHIMLCVFVECMPTKIWMLVRHGTRNPSAAVIRKMQKRLPQIRDMIINEGSSSVDHMSSLRKWAVHITDKDEKQLTHEGEEEMLLLARRMQRRFPDILNSAYSNSSYKVSFFKPCPNKIFSYLFIFQFKFTATQRTEESAKYFAIGLFGVENASGVWFPRPSTKDPILRVMLMLFLFLFRFHGVCITVL